MTTQSSWNPAAQILRLSGRQPTKGMQKHGLSRGLVTGFGCFENWSGLSRAALKGFVEFGLSGTLNVVQRNVLEHTGFPSFVNGVETDILFTSFRGPKV